MRARHHQALIAGATAALGLWFLTTRFRGIQAHGSQNEGIAIADGNVPHVLQNGLEDNRLELDYTDGKKSEVAYAPAPTEDTAVEAPSPTPRVDLDRSWDRLETLPEWSTPSPTPVDVDPTPSTSGISQAMVDNYVRAIMDSEDNSTFKRFSCPWAIGPRYENLRATVVGRGQVRYFFALDLYQSAEIIPRLMSSIVEAIRYLGPAHCAISVIEGRSEDGTYEILAALKSQIEAMGSHFSLSTSNVNPTGGDMSRIEALAELRNKALDPLKTINTMGHGTELAGTFSPEAVIIFINDIALCPEDILELVLQHVSQDAHMTCAFDWIFNGTLFYDVWVSRSLVGNTFFEIPHDGSWTYSKDMFFDEPDGKRRYEAFQPMQVYSCWGGMVTLDAAPFAEERIQFRASEEGECYMGEPTLLAKDLYRHGLGKILAVPSVNVAYSDKEAVGTKHVRGYVGNHVNMSKPTMDEEEYVQWQSAPPGMLKCMPNFDQQTWTRST
ncbi:uncharacterized protein N7459_001345 [Penicillium hispanicum]|uniref:uncharacterized protein n=1 Tax=Penicillium hispanicum TaxID=1080232 RepID=UPI0025401E43|nr:uncharacterized protein N7459_001345 [Penicillium hispanicum]KAJ5595137.1 hypothetical protein N7459_001345 [Penicillium hispanicum]